MKRALTAAALVVALAGCSLPATTTGTPGAGDGSAGSKPTATTEQDQSSDGTAKIGQKYTYDDGLAIEITSTKQSKIGRYAAGGKPGEPLAILAIRIKNGTKTKVSADLVSVQLTYGADGEEAEAVFQEGIDGFSGTITKGGSRTAKYAFAVPKKSMKNVTVEIGTDFDRESAIFKGAIG